MKPPATDPFQEWQCLRCGGKVSGPRPPEGLCLNCWDAAHAWERYRLRTPPPERKKTWEQTG